MAAIIMSRCFLLAFIVCAISAETEYDRKTESEMETRTRRFGDNDGQLFAAELMSKLRQLEDKFNDTSSKLQQELEYVKEKLKTTETELVDLKIKYEAVRNRPGDFNLRTKPSTETNTHLTAGLFQRAIAPSSEIAFSAYLDHDLITLGKGQAITFNQIITNDGNAYNRFSGMFTAPVTGMYAFHISIGIKANPPEEYVEFWAQLKRNSENIIDAAAEVRIVGEDQQASNFVILHLNVGDVVYVAEMYGSKLHGSSTLRLSNFSGFLFQ